MHVIDIPFIFLLAVCIPLLVHRMLDRDVFPQSLQQRVIIGGWLWLIYALFNEQISGFTVGIWASDDGQHEIMARGFVDFIDQGRWDLVWSHWSTGNAAWQIYLAVMYAFTGASKRFSICLNVMLAFWGGLILVREWVRILPKGRPVSSWPLLVIFFPSVVYWCAWNLKEGPMYWAICLIFSAIRTEKLTLGDLFRAGVGILVGGVLRPHIIVGWAMTMAAVNILVRGRQIVAIAMLIMAPAALALVATRTGVEQDVIEQVLERGYGQAATLASRDSGSRIDYGPGGPTLFVSGFVCLFFRPFIWEARKLSMLLSALEILMTTLFMLWVWWSMNNGQRWFFLKMPQIQAAILACLFFCLFFTFTANAGLIARQRVQAIPALLTLAFVPYLYKRALMDRIRNGRLMSTARGALSGTVPNSRFLGRPRSRTAP